MVSCGESKVTSGDIHLLKRVLQIAAAMSNTKTHALVFVLTLFWVWPSSCGEKTKEDCAKHIEEKIRQGASLEVAQAKLKECGFKTTSEPAKNILYAEKVVEGKPVSERHK
jgi:hypothetical protein